MRGEALWCVLLLMGCHEQRLMRVIDPDKPIGQVDCTCRFEVESAFDACSHLAACDNQRP